MAAKQLNHAHEYTITVHSSCQLVASIHSQKQIVVLANNLATVVT